MFITIEIYYVNCNEVAVTEEIDINPRQICALFSDEVNEDYCYITMRNGCEYNVTMTRDRLKKLIKKKELLHLLQ